MLAALTGQPAFGRATASPALPPAPSDRVTPEPLLQARGLLLEAEGAWLQRVAAAWQHGRVSNFDYLLYLNLAAGAELGAVFAPCAIKKAFHLEQHGQDLARC